MMLSDWIELPPMGGLEVDEFATARWRIEVAQINPDPTYDHRLAEWATSYLQTKDPAFFPFATHFDADQRRAFVHALRVGLADLQDSGSARKSSATGFIMNDSLLHDVVREWAAAGGNWPPSSDPQNPDGLVNLILGRRGQ
ncbi:hypothetical protein BH23CHL4_BH23CHL4_01850 [soil metagenome]